MLRSLMISYFILFKTGLALETRSNQDIIGKRSPAGFSFNNTMEGELIMNDHDIIELIDNKGKSLSFVNGDSISITLKRSWLRYYSLNFEHNGKKISLPLVGSLNASLDKLYILGNDIKQKYDLYFKSTDVDLGSEIATGSRPCMYAGFCLKMDDKGHPTIAFSHFCIGTQQVSYKNSYHQREFLLKFFGLNGGDKSVPSALFKGKEPRHLTNQVVVEELTQCRQ